MPRTRGAYVDCGPSEAPLAREQDATRLVKFCPAHRAPATLLHEGDLADEFFDLKTGLAGSVLQKLATYRVRAAPVMSSEHHLAGRFGEFVRETNRGAQFRVFTTRAAAVAWLTAPAPDGG